MRRRVAHVVVHLRTDGVGRQRRCRLVITAKQLIPLQLVLEEDEADAKEGEEDVQCGDGNLNVLHAQVHQRLVHQ